MQRRVLYARGLIALVAVPAATVFVVWAIRTIAIDRFRSSVPGQIVRQYEYVAPQIELRDKEVEELTRP